MAGRRLICLAAAALLVAVPAASAATTVREPGGDPSLVRLWGISYRAHDGVERNAYVVLPRWYRPSRDPPLPVVIAPHGRGVGALETAGLWGDLPAQGPFALVCPEGQGRRLALYSWGAPGQIDDLARMPRIVHAALPWVRIDSRRIYAFGGSMGGQETLLLVARFPRLLAGAAAFDAPTDLARRYADFGRLRHGTRLQQLARYEVGAAPVNAERAYRRRSPLEFARRIAFSGVPLQLWWSRADRVVADQREESGRLYREIERLNRRAPVVEVVGWWRHTMELRSDRALPTALSWFGLVTAPPRRRPPRPESPSRSAFP